METVHRVFYEFEILLAVNFIEREEKADIIAMVRRKVWGGVDEVNLNDTINDEITELENQNNVDSPVFSTTSSASPRPSSCERYMSDETLMDVLDMNNLQDSFG